MTLNLLSAWKFTPDPKQDFHREKRSTILSLEKKQEDSKGSRDSNITRGKTINNLDVMASCLLITQCLETVAVWLGGGVQKEGLLPREGGPCEGGHEGDEHPFGEGSRGCRKVVPICVCGSRTAWWSTGVGEGCRRVEGRAGSRHGNL